MHMPGRSARPLQFLLSTLLMALTLAACTQQPAPASPVALRPAGITPASFEDRRVASVAAPIDLTFTPDGRMLIATQGGQLRLLQNGSLLSTPALDLQGRACTSNGWGLLGVTTDPQFASNGHLYVFYTSNKNGNCTASWTDGPVNRVSRFTMSANSASLASERVLVDNIPANRGSHNGGDLAFGADGKLYISVGDGYCQLDSSNECAALNSNARSRSHLLGKVLRINRDGSVPDDNPFVNQAGARNCGDPGGVPGGSGPCAETYAWGLRNPFRMAFKPGTDELYINDVGQEHWEEINLGRAGADYGWNLREGNCARGSTSDCGAAPDGMTNPVFAYGRHQGQFDGCKSITGGAFVPSGLWPREYEGTYLFADYVCGKIFRLSPDGSGGYRADTFVTGLGESSAVAMAFGPAGNSQALYYLSYAGGGEVRAIRYTGTANRAPTARASASATSGALPLAVTFDASASSDPDGDPLRYSWTFGDGGTASGAKVTHTYTSAGSFTARVTVTDGRGGSATASVRIDAGNTAPRVEILTPSTTDTFRVGQTVTLQGRASDAEDGTLDGSRLSWRVELRHNDDHSHPILQGASGTPSITTPAPEGLSATERSYLLITLTATDSRGLSSTTTRRYQPRRVNITLGTQPDGLQLGVNDTTFSAPRTFTSWEGYVLKLSAPGEQSSGGQSYALRGWSDGGAPSHTITTPAQSATYTATYEARTGQGASLTLINADTDQPIAGFDPVPPGAMIVLSELPTRRVSFRANVTAGSVRFTHDGATVRTENHAPYAVAGDGWSSGRTDYWPWPLSPGYHTLVATPYSGSDASGTPGVPAVLHYSVYETRPARRITGLTLIDADTDRPIAGHDPIAQGAVITLAQLPSRNIAVRAHTGPATVGSVRFSLNGSTVRTENYAPYAIAGDARHADGRADYARWPVPAGRHTLTVTPYSERSASGSAGPALTLSFELK